MAVAHVAPVLGGPIAAIALGLALRRFGVKSTTFEAGTAFASKPLLQISIVVLGATLSLGQVWKTGIESLPVMLATILVALLVAYCLGRMLGIGRDLTALIGVGTAICGASAIAATSAVIKPKKADVAYALGTILVFNLVAVVSFPLIGHLFDMDQQTFGIWAGTAVNDTSSVVATAYSFGDEAGSEALVVKLTRTLALIPMIAGLAWLWNRREAENVPWKRILPLFIVGFLIAASLRTVGIVPAAWSGEIAWFGTFLISAALAGIGLSLDLGEVRTAGMRPLIVGAATWLSVVIVGLAVQFG